MLVLSIQTVTMAQSYRQAQLVSQVLKPLTFSFGTFFNIELGIADTESEILYSSHRSAVCAALL